MAHTALLLTFLSLLLRLAITSPISMDVQSVAVRDVEPVKGTLVEAAIDFEPSKNPVQVLSLNNGTLLGVLLPSKDRMHVTSPAFRRSKRHLLNSGSKLCAGGEEFVVHKCIPIPELPENED